MQLQILTFYVPERPARLGSLQPPPENGGWGADWGAALLTPHLLINYEVIAGALGGQLHAGLPGGRGFGGGAPHCAPLLEIHISGLPLRLLKVPHLGLPTSVL